jgi:hypothetical protein
MSSSNIYNILSKLNALQPKAEEPKAQATKPIYESVEPRGSIMSGVAKLEQKLSEQFAADKKALDTNPKNAAWDDDAGAKQRARIAREKQKIGMQRKISGQDTGLPPAVQESLIDDDSTDIGELLNFNLFRDYQSFKDGDIDDPSELRVWKKLFAKFGPIADKLEAEINAAAGSGAALTPEQNQEINDNWYDGSDAYDDPLNELPGIYSHEIKIIQNILGQSSNRNGMAEEAAPVKYGVFSKGGSIGSQRFKDDPLKTFDSKEEAIADAKRRRSGLSKGERGYYRMGYVVKAIKGVAEGWDDMIKAGKERDAADRSGKKSTTSGVKHHGKYGTEYQGDADEEAAAKAADKGPKKRGRPAKGLAKPKPATGEKKGRGRPKKAADPTYSGAKDLQNYIVGNLPKGKQAKGKVHKIDEGRMLDEAGQHLDHILNRFKHEVRNFEETGDLDQDSDLYHALHDYYKETGLLPYDIEKGRGAVSTLTWVADQLDQHLGISEEAMAPAAAPAFKRGDVVTWNKTPGMKYTYVRPVDGQPGQHYITSASGSDNIAAGTELVPAAAPAAAAPAMAPTSAFKKGDKVTANGAPATVTGVDAVNSMAYVQYDQDQGTNKTSGVSLGQLKAAAPAAPAAPAMEAELNELAKLAGLTVEAKVKPDYIDLDKDGNKKEPMSQAAQDAEDDDHDYANRLDDEQMDENIPVHKHVDGPFDPNSTSDDDEEGDVCPECDGAGCPECYGDEHRDRAHGHAQGMQRESAIREAEEMINFMRNAGLDTSRAESALAEAYKYGDTDVEEAPEYANSPDEEIQNVDAITRQGNDLNREKKQFAGKPKAGDNPMASESTDPLEAMGRRLMQAYESIKVVDEGMVDKVKGMFGKKKDPNAVPNIFDTEPYKSDTKAYLKKSAKQPGGPNNVKNIFDK